MKKLVRKFCFETNSSSSHSIALAGEDKQFVLDTLYPNQKGVITLTGGEYGWEWFKTNEASEKANYAAQDLGWNQVLIDVIKEQTGATEVIINTEHGYIDHDSTGLVPRDKEGLRNFIFNKNSWLFGGNDNSTADPTFYHVPEYKIEKKTLLNNKNVEHVRVIEPVYKYELVIEGLNKTTKFLEYPTEEEISDGINAILGHGLMYDSGHFIDEETTHSIYFQLNRIRDLFEMSYHVEQDFSKGYIVMTRENAMYSFEDKLEKEGKFKDLNWHEKRKLITEEVLKDEEISRKVKFTVKEI